MRWFRLYDEVLNDPKVQNLSADMFKMWVNILCLASKNDGVLPPISDVAFALRCNAGAVTEAFHILLEAKLLTVTKNQHGEVYQPHNWAKRQFKSDTSSDRVKRHRERKKTVSCNVTETAPDTDTEQIKKINKKKPELFDHDDSDLSAGGRVRKLEDLKLDDPLRKWFREKTPDVKPEAVLESLILYCRSKGRKYADYRAALQTFARSEQQKITQKKPPEKGKITNEQWDELIR